MGKGIVRHRLRGGTWAGLRGLLLAHLSVGWHMRDTLSATKVPPYQKPRAYVKKHAPNSSPLPSPTLNPLWIPTRIASNRKRRYWLITAGCALSAVTVRTAPSVSVANPPAAAYCPDDSFYE